MLLWRRCVLLLVAGRISLGTVTVEASQTGTCLRRHCVLEACSEIGLSAQKLSFPLSGLSHLNHYICHIIFVILLAITGSKQPRGNILSYFYEMLKIWAFILTETFYLCCYCNEELEQLRYTSIAIANWGIPQMQRLGDGVCSPKAPSMSTLRKKMLGIRSVKRCVGGRTSVRTDRRRGGREG